MQIIYTCPECGADLREEVLLRNPPITKMICDNCGWGSEEDEYIVRIPYATESDFDISNACKHCSNNPRNGGSGICHCILGNNITYC